MKRIRRIALLLALSARLATAQEVVPPPPEVFDRYREADRDVARRFYGKYLDVRGVPVLASGSVDDQALRRTHEIVSHLLADRPDVLEAMAKNRTRLIVIGKDQVYTDMPEYRNDPNPLYLNERVRGTGGLGVTSFGEENLLNLAGDRYDDESIGLHEFCHTIDAALGRVDDSWRPRLRDTYRKAIADGLWKDAYAASNPGEYWAEICQSYFNCNRVNNWNHNNVGTRDQLKRYDPLGYELVRSTFRLTPEHDWTLKPIRVQPSVIAPPARFPVDPHYAKFTFAREFPVIGSDKVSDAALLRANETIRKMFAYRHDILKAMILDGARLVVLGKGEKLSDLPEFRDSKEKPGFDEARSLDYDSKMKLIVAPEENVLGLPGDTFDGEGVIVGLFARGLYHVAATRPVDPDFAARPLKQQYELRVKRLDVDFDRALKDAYDAAMAKMLWRGTPAARDRVEYWASGVEAYFEASGRSYPPVGADRPIVSRDGLKAYDPGLFALVDETMAYRGHADWRYRR